MEHMTPTSFEPGQSQPDATNPGEAGRYVLKLLVNDHPGVMSHVCGLFARRCYNLEGVMVRAIRGSDRKSRMWLLLNDDGNSDQIMRQTEKLMDVLAIERQEVAGSVFERTEQFFDAYN